MLEIEEESKGSILKNPEKPKNQKEESKGSKESLWKVRDKKLSEVQPKPIRWLIEDFLPLNELTLLAGREGLGKSTLAVEIAAKVSNGSYGKAENVAYLALEDSLERTVRTRFEAAGADLERVKHFWLANGDSERTPSFPNDFELLLEWVKEQQIRFLVLDPLPSTLSERVDTHNDRQARTALERIAKLAQEGECTVLGLVHINKASESDFSNRVLGSRAFSAVARLVLGLARDEQDPEQKRLLLGVAKSNLGQIPKTMKSFLIESATIETQEGETLAGRVIWLPEVQGFINEQLGQFTSQEEKEERSEIKAALLELIFHEGEHTLQGIRIGSKKIEEFLRQASLSTSSEALQKYKRLIEAKPYKAKEKSGAWYWEVPSRLFKSYYPDSSDSSDSSNE